jgi:hypothetical protein
VKVIVGVNHVRIAIPQQPHHHGDVTTAFVVRQMDHSGMRSSLMNATHRVTAAFLPEILLEVVIQLGLVVLSQQLQPAPQRHPQPPQQLLHQLVHVVNALLMGVPFSLKQVAHFAVESGREPGLFVTSVMAIVREPVFTVA